MKKNEAPKLNKNMLLHFLLAIIIVLHYFRVKLNTSKI